MSTRASRLLSRRFAGLVAFSAVPLALLIVALAFLHYAQQRDRKLDALRGLIVDRYLAFRALAVGTVTHVDQMRHWAEAYLETQSGRLSPLLPLLAVEAGSDERQLGGYFLDREVDPLMPGSTGNFLGDDATLAGGRHRLASVSLALDIFALQQLGHVAHPEFRRSTFAAASGHFLSTYPAIPRAAYARAGGDLEAVIATLLDREVFRRVAPSLNPERLARWTPVEDPLLTGNPVLSRAAPVYHGDRFVGVVATDIPLSVLAALLQRPGSRDGFAWLIDDGGGVLAASRPSVAPPGGAAVASLADAASLGFGEFVRQDGYYIYQLAIGSAPWRLVYAIPQGELLHGFPTSVPAFLAILLGLVVTLIVGHLLVRAQFVRPIVALTEFVRAGARGAPYPPPRLPRIWRPWLAVLNATFQRNRLYLDRLKRSEDRYRRLAELSPNGIMLHDRSGIVFLNPAGCTILGLSDPAEAIGRPFADFALPETRDATTAQMLAALEDGRAVPLEERQIQRRDGSRPTIEVTATPFVGDDPQTVLVIFRDVTQRREAEERLRQSEEQFRAIAEAVPVPIAITRREDHCVVFANKQCLDIFGIPDDGELELDTGPFFADPADRERLIGALEAHGSVEGAEVVLKRMDGGRFPALVSVQPMTHRGQPATLTGVIDVTALKEAERSLRDSEAMKSAIIAAAMDCIVAADEGGRIIEFSPAAERTFGRHRAEMLGRPLGAVVRLPGRRDPDLARYLSSAGGHWLGRRIESEATRADGAEFPVELAINRTTLSGPRLFTVSLRDITERHRMEQALRDSEQRFRAIAEADPVPVAITRQHDGCFLYVNPACRALLQMPEGDSARWRSVDFYDDPSRRDALVRQMLREGRIDGYELRLRRVDGSHFWGRLTTVPMVFNGEAAQISAVVDLTERIRAEEELARQREILHQKEKFAALGSLLAGLAHELNNPLSVVVGQAIILQELTANTTLTARAERIRNAADRCSRIVKTFLTMARSRQAARGRVDLDRLIRSALEIAGYGLRSVGVDVVVKLDPAVPVLWADGDQLHQVLSNLIVNAQQAMQEVDGPRRLTIRSVYDAAARHVVIEVTDNGQGVPAELRDRVFEPFFTTKPEGAGTGIGLSVCRDIIDAHGGDIRVATPEGGGAAFTIRLPVGEPDACGEGEAPRPADIAGIGAILVIDDDLEIAQTLADILRVGGHDVQTASSGPQGLQCLKDQDYDLIFCDVRMPEMDGPAFLETLSSLHPDMADRVVFVTGDTLGTDVPALVRDTGAPVVEKPFDTEVINKLVAERFAVRRVRERARGG